MATKKAPDELLKQIDAMSEYELKDAVVRTCIRQARAESDLAHYKETYGEVIKEEKERRNMYLSALEIRAEAARRQLIAEVGVEDATTDEERDKAVEIVRLVQQGAQA